MCLCHHRSPVARDSSRAFASLSTFNFGLLTSFSPTLSHTSEKSPASSKYCHTSKTPSRNSFTIRTSETPLPQLLYNPHLRARLGSAGNKGLITPLESALTKNSPVTPVESALTKKWGVGVYPANAEFLFRGAEGEEVLGAFDGFLKAAQKELEVVAALDEVNVRRVDHEEVRGRVAKEEVFVGARDFLDVFEGDATFVARSLLGDAGAEDFGLGLEIDDEIGSGKVRGEGFVIALVKFELFVGEVEIGEDAVLLHEEIGEERAGSFDGEGFAEALLALDEEVHLGAEG